MTFIFNELVRGATTNGTYYVVIACPKAKYIKLWLVSAYISKNESGIVTQESDAEAPNSTSKTELASPNATNNNLSQPNAKNNPSDENSSERRSSRAQLDNDLEISRLQKENKKQSDLVEKYQDYIKPQRTQTHGTKSTKASIDYVGKELSDKYNMKRGSREFSIHAPLRGERPYG